MSSRHNREITVPMISFEFPYPPSVNTYYRANGHRRFITKKGMEFRAKVADMVSESNLPTLAQELEVFVTLYPPDKRRRDLDNPMKALLDAMEHAGVYEDDSQIVKLTIEKRPPVKGGKCCVVIV